MPPALTQGRLAVLAGICALFNGVGRAHAGDSVPPPQVHDLELQQGGPGGHGPAVPARVGRLRVAVTPRLEVLLGGPRVTTK